MKKLKLIGYWNGDGAEENYPDPRNFVDHDWKQGKRDQIVNYLKSGHFFRGSWDFASCRMDPNRDPREMGSREFTDGVYAWPEGLAVYVAEYGIVLPEEFYEHMEQNQFKVPEVLTSERYIADSDFWLSYSESR